MTGISKPQGDERPRRPAQLNFRNHCFLCLLPQPISTIQNQIRNNPKGLKCFQPILHYLTGTDTTFDKSREECGRKGIPLMPNMPPMCVQCYETLAELFQLHEQLLGVQWRIQKQTEVAREIVRMAGSPSSTPGEGEAASSSRSKFYERIKASGSSEEEVAVVSKFVDGLHHKIIAEANGKVHFPSCPPPDFTPTPPSPVITTPITLSGLTLPSLTLVQLPNGTSTLVSTPQPQPQPSLPQTGRKTVTARTAAPNRTITTRTPIPIPTSSTSTTGHAPDSDSDVQIEEENDSVQTKQEVITLDSSDEEGRSDPPKLSPSKPAQSSTSQSGIQIQPQTYILLGASTPAPPPSSQQPASSRPKIKLLRKKRIPRDDPNLSKKLRWYDMKSLPNYVPRFVRGQPAAQKCDLCHELVPLGRIREHMEAHVGDFVTPCPSLACPFLFSCRRKMEQHLTRSKIGKKRCAKQLRLPEGPLVRRCETCGLFASFGSGVSFLAHIQRHESDVKEKLLPCPILHCTEKFGLRQSVDEHIFCHDLRPVKLQRQQCSVCRENLSVEEVATHLQEKHPDQVEEVISCKQCPFQFHSSESLLDHQLEHPRGGFSCHLCDDPEMKFDRYENLRQHYFTKHQVGTTLLCEHCDKTFFALASLSSHKRRKHQEHQPKTEPEATPSNSNSSQSQVKSGRQRGPWHLAKKMIQCDICSFTVPRAKKWAMNRHKSLVHSNAPLTCRFCSKTCASLTALQTHEKEHTGIRRREYKCDVEGCTKIFYSRTILENHKQAHSGIKSFICDLCGKAYSSPAALKFHNSSAHLGVKYMCEDCGENFVSKTVLQRHKLIHTGEKPFSCHICGQAFRFKGVMQTHVKGHEAKGPGFKPNGPMKRIRKRVERKGKD